MTDVSYSVCFYDLPAAELVVAAQAAEDLGFDTFWLGEHLLRPATYRSVHPTRDEASERREPIVDDRTELVDPWVMAGAVGAATRRIRFGTGVYLAALRHPLISARSMATASSLSGGRLVVGLGAGWLREEFDALGVGFDDRGARLDEAIAVIRQALDGGPFGHEGTFWRFDPVQVCAAPVLMPLVVGGNSAPALRRAARLADGWFNSGAADLDQLCRSRERIERERARADRAGLPFEYWVRPARLDGSTSAGLAVAGFTNQVVWGHQMWPGDSRIDIEEKRHMMRAAAAELGVRPLGAGARR